MVFDNLFSQIKLKNNTGFQYHINFKANGVYTIRIIQFWICSTC